jgi:FixJ family two-component response regulator
LNAPEALVCVVDDDSSVRRGLVRLLRAAGLRAQGFPSAEAFLARDPSPAVGCLVLDVRMPGLDGLALQERMAATANAIPIVFLSGHGDIPMSVRAIKRGAEDFLTKPVDDKVLLDAVRAGLRRNRAAALEAEALSALRRRLDALTPRERQVLGRVLVGDRNKQVAARLGIAEKTVKVHRSRIMEKLGVSTVAQLAHRCAQAGVVPEEFD